MNEFMTRLTSYNLFNFLFPGALFVYLSRMFLGINLGADTDKGLGFT